MRVQSVAPSATTRYAAAAPGNASTGVAGCACADPAAMSAANNATSTRRSIAVARQSLPRTAAACGPRRESAVSDPAPPAPWRAASAAWWEPGLSRGAARDRHIARAERIELRIRAAAAAFATRPALRAHLVVAGAAADEAPVARSRRVRACAARRRREVLAALGEARLDVAELAGRRRVLRRILHRLRRPRDGGAEFGFLRAGRCRVRQSRASIAACRCRRGTGPPRPSSPCAFIAATSCLMVDVQLPARAPE